jgi:serine/threonine protein kinase
MLQILLDVSLGMAHLHREGMIHRDLAARNVLLTNERPRRAKISDFGFAKVNDGLDFVNNADY